MGQKTRGFDDRKMKTVQSYLEVHVWLGQPACPRWQQMGEDMTEMMDKKEETRNEMRGIICQGCSRQWNDSGYDCGYV